MADEYGRTGYGARTSDNKTSNEGGGYNKYGTDNYDRIGGGYNKSGGDDEYKKSGGDDEYKKSGGGVDEYGSSWEEPENYSKEEKEHLGEMGNLASGASAMYEKQANALVQKIVEHKEEAQAN